MDIYLVHLFLFTPHTIYGHDDIIWPEITLTVNWLMNVLQLYPCQDLRGKHVGLRQDRE